MDVLRVKKRWRGGIDSSAEACDAAVVEWDARLVVTAWRGRAQSMFGRAPSETIGRTIEQLGFPPTLRDGTPGESITFGAPQFIEVARKDGRIVSCRMRQSVVRNRTRSFFIDVTDERAADRAACERKRWESLGTVAGGTAHSFNNLLTGVIGHATLLLERTPTTDQSRADLEAIVECAERAAEIARRMLDYSGHGHVAPRSVNINRTIATALDRIAPIVRPRIELTTRYSPQDLQIRGDWRQIEDLVEALIMNAVEAIENHTGKIEVTTTIEKLDRPFEISTGMLDSGHYVKLRIRDNGCGMDAATRARMFDPFFSTKFVGRGLGLAAAAGILRGHAGGIQVDSQVGRGTAIEVFLKESREGTAQPNPRTGKST